jgi:Nitrous oxide-stimulated promoter
LTSNQWHSALGCGSLNGGKPALLNGSAYYVANAMHDAADHPKPRPTLLDRVFPRTPKRLARERRTIESMIRLYCRHEHGGDGLCDECAELRDFAFLRLTKCPYSEAKPACAKCPIHCYKPERREQIRKVMRFAGPRMLLRHPVLAIRHLIDDRKEAPPLPKKGKGRE